MAETELDTIHGDSRRRIGATVIALGLCIALVASMAWMVLREIEELSSANSDNLQWSLAQADVEFLRFQLELEKAQGDPARLPDLRRRFDIFYSRMATLEQGAVFMAMREDPAFDHPRRHVSEFLEASVPLIDGTDDDLHAALPRLAAEARHISDDVRTLSLAGLSAFAELSDERRQQLARTMLMMASVLVTLFAGLVLLALSLFRLVRLGQAREAQIHRTAGRLRTIVETALDAIVVTDANGSIREFNPAAQHIFGYARDEARGKRAMDLLFPADMAENLREGALRFLDRERAPAHHEKHLEVTAIDRFGRRFPAEISIDRADADDGLLYVAYIRDISRRKAAEEGLTVARDRALAGERAKAEFLAVMSHEMRTPLNGLLGSMQLMYDHSLTEEQTNLLNRMQSSGRLLLGLVNDVLDLAKFEAGKMRPELRPFQISRVLDGIVETAAPLATDNKNTIGWSWIGKSRDQVVGDSRRLRQILLNLVGNAVKFTRSGSVEIEVEALRDGVTVEFRVIDTGIGISEEDLERIFQDFETLDSSHSRNAGGTGLGLGISRRMTEMLGGEIGAESEPGEGSLFWVRMPLETSTEEIAPRDAGARPAERIEQRPLDLLLVEDNEINRFVARQMLEAEGHKVTEANNGRAGVEWAEAQAFDAILMDISMPVMDGYEATGRIRAGSGPSADVPIIAVTAHALPEDIARFEEAGMNYNVSKPLDRATLMETLAKATRPGASAPAARPAGRPAEGTPPVTRSTAKRAGAAWAGSAGAPTPPAEKLIDTDQLSSLWSGLGPKASAHLFQSFVSETTEVIGTLSTFDPEDPNLAAVAHKCAGSCGTFGAAALRRALNQIETASKRGTPVTAAELAALDPLWQRSLQAMESWRTAA